jgi:hypothetical protein
MRPDQIERIRALSEDVAEAVIIEADPQNWTGAGKLPQDMSQKERGDRVWDKRGAAASIAILQRLVSLVVDSANPHDGRSDEADEEQADIGRAAEAAAEDMLRRVMGGKARAS